MRRPPLTTVLSLAILSAAAPPAVASTIGPDLATMDARIETAHARVERWYERIERWYERIERASARVERLEARLERSGGSSDDVLRRRSPRWAEPSFLFARASRELRRR